jgi:hypothetical protein
MAAASLSSNLLTNIIVSSRGMPGTKHSSLLWIFVSSGLKKFYNVGPEVEVIVAENHGVEVELPFEGKKLQASML